MHITITIPKNKELTKDYYVHKKNDDGKNKPLPKNRGRVKTEHDYVWKTLEIDSIGIKHDSIAWELLYNAWNNIRATVAPDTSDSVTVKFATKEDYIKFLYSENKQIIGHVGKTSDPKTSDTKKPEDSFESSASINGLTPNETLEKKKTTLAEDLKKTDKILQKALKDAAETKVIYDLGISSETKSDNPYLEGINFNFSQPVDINTKTSPSPLPVDNITDEQQNEFNKPSSEETPKTDSHKIDSNKSSIFNRKTALTIICVLSIKIIVVSFFYTTIKAFILNYLTLGAIAAFFSSEAGIITMASISVLAIAAISISYGFGVKKFHIHNDTKNATNSDEFDKITQMKQNMEGCDKQQALNSTLDLTS